MKNISAALKAHMSGNPTSLAYLWKVKPVGPSVPQIVQSTSGFGSVLIGTLGGLTLGGSPTPGNYLLAVIRASTSGVAGTPTVGSINSGADGLWVWNPLLVVNSGAGTPSIGIWYAVVPALATGASVKMNTAGNEQEAWLCEISNVNSVDFASNTGTETNADVTLDPATCTLGSESISVVIGPIGGANWTVAMFKFSGLSGHITFALIDNDLSESLATVPGWSDIAPSQDHSTAELLYLRTLGSGPLGFTTHDQDITYTDETGDTITYLGRTGFTNSASASKSDLSVDNLEVTAFLDSESLTEEDLRAGVYDDALIEIRVVNWADLTMGDLWIRSGTLGNVKMKNSLFTAEIRGLAYKLSANLGALYGPVCRATFGSGRNNIDMNSQYKCMIDVAALAQTGSVGSAIDARTIIPAGGLFGAAGYFNDGYIEFTSGVMNGFKFEIKIWDGSRLVLFLPMPVPPAAGDTFSIEPGCDHLTDDCQNKFANIVNFRAEPFIPGNDAILDYPNV